MDGVYNSELMAPYDVIHHSVFRDSSDYIEPFVVSPDGEPVTTFEGLTVAIPATAKKLEIPSMDEGFDELWYVRIDDGRFVVEEWNDEV